MSTKHFQYENAIPWEDLGEGVQRQMFGWDEKIMLVKIKFEAGAVGKLHHHLNSQASYIVSGVYELTIGDEKKVLRPGDGYYVAPHVEHGLLCLEPGMLIDSFSPYREDFL